MPLSSSPYTEVHDACSEAVLMSSKAQGYCYARFAMDVDGRYVPQGQPVELVADTSTWTNAVWLEFPHLLVRLSLEERGSTYGSTYMRFNVADESAVPLILTDGQPVTCTRSGFLLDHRRRTLALCEIFEVPLFDLVTMRQIDCMQLRRAVSSIDKTIYRSEDQSILLASYEGLYRTRLGENRVSWSVEHPTLFNCSLLGYSQSRQSYVLLNQAHDRVGFVHEKLAPFKWWEPEAGSIEIPTDHSLIRLNDRGDQVLVLRRNKSIDVRPLHDPCMTRGQVLQ